MINSGWSKTKKIIALALFVIFAIGVIFFFPTQVKAPHEIIYAETRVSLPTRDVSVVVEVADTVEKRTLGLSGRENLASNRGMLFVFDTDGAYGFWMKDMNFALDILWFDNNLRLVDMWQNANPDSYPKIVEPHSPARYVLEVPAGFAKEHSLATGDSVQIDALGHK